MGVFLDCLYPESLCYLLETEAAQDFNTAITPSGGSTEENRVARWGEMGRRSFIPSVATMEREQVEELRAFYNIVIGRAYSFALNWPTDNSALDSLLANTAGGTSFQLRKEYRVPYFEWDSAEEVTYISRFQPVRLCLPNTVYLTLNGQPIPVDENPDTFYLFNEPEFNAETSPTASVNRAGVVTLSSSITADDILRATFNYHFQVRFDSDRFSERYRSHEAWSVGLPMIETNDPVT